MATFLMFGKYGPKALKEMSAERTTQAVALIRKLGGSVEAMYATLGEHDLVFVLSFPSNEDAMKASVVLTEKMGIAFSTSPAVTVEEFDKLMGQI